MARERVEGKLDDKDIVLNNAATEATLEELLSVMQKMAKAQGLNEKDQRQNRRDAEAYASSQKEAKKQTKSFSEEIDQSTNALEDFNSGLSKVGGAFGFLFKATGSLVAGTYNLAEEFMTGGDRLSDFLGKFAVIGPISRALDDNLQVYRNISNVGASFGNSMQDMRLTAARARVGLEDFQTMISNNAETFAVFGDTVSSGARRFAQFAGNFRESDIGSRFLGMGFTIEELNDRLAGYLELEARRDRLEIMTQSQINDGAERYLDQLDRLAKVTGMQRSEAEDLILQQQRDAKLRRMEMDMTGRERENFRGTVAVMDQMTPAFSGIMKDLIDGAAQTADAQQFLVALGPEQNRFLSFMKEAGRGDIGEEEFRNRLSTFAPAIDDFISGLSDAQIDAIRIHQPELAAVLDASVEIRRLNNDALDAAAQAEQDRRESITEALSSFSQTLASVRSRLLVTFLQSGVFQRIQNNLDELAANISTEDVAAFIDEHITPKLQGFSNALERFVDDVKIRGFGPAVQDAVIDLFNNVKTFIFGGTRERRIFDEASKVNRTVEEERKGLISKFAEGLSNWYDTSGLKAVFEQMANDIKNSIIRTLAGGLTVEERQRQQQLRQRLDYLENEAPSAGGAAIPIPADPELRRERGDILRELADFEERQKGVLGFLGKMLLDEEVLQGKVSRRQGSSQIENFGKGTPAMLHGREAVLTEDQLFNMANGAFIAGSKNAVGSIAEDQLFNMANGAFIAGSKNAVGSLATADNTVSANIDYRRLDSVSNNLAELKTSIDSLSNTLTTEDITTQQESSVLPANNNSQTTLERKLDQLNTSMQDVVGILANTHDVSKRQLKNFKGMNGNLHRGIA